MRAQQIASIPNTLRPMQSTVVTRPSQAAVVPIATPTGAVQLEGIDINSIMNMMILVVVVVMMMKMMGGAVGGG